MSPDARIVKTGEEGLWLPYPFKDVLSITFPIGPTSSKF